MNGKIELKEEPEKFILSIRTRTKMENLPNIIGTSYMKLMAYLNELGEKPLDVPFTAYYNLDMQNLDVEMGFIVSHKLPDKDDMIAGIISSGKSVSYMHKGPYNKMQEAYDEIMKWINNKNLKMKGIYYEYYYNSPEEVEESELLTRIVIPVEE